MVRRLLAGDRNAIDPYLSRFDNGPYGLLLDEVDLLHKAQALDQYHFLPENRNDGGIALMANGWSLIDDTVDWDAFLADSSGSQVDGFRTSFCGRRNRHIYLAGNGIQLIDDNALLNYRECLTLPLEAVALRLLLLCCHRLFERRAPHWVFDLGR